MVTRRSAVGLVLLLVAGCGGGGAASTTTTITTSTTTTTTTAPVTTTTTEAVTDPLARLLTAPVINPLAASGFGEMEYTDEEQTAIRSVETVTAAGERLVITTLDPVPVITGLGSDQFLLAAHLAAADGAVGATATVLFSLVQDTWVASAIINDASVLEFLESTTDYAAVQPDGEVLVRTTLDSFDWGPGASFAAAVLVLEPDGTEVFHGAVACVVGDALECELTSDDGVLRPGDTGEDVEALQSLLIDLGYLGGAPGGNYNNATRDAVRAFQRDYRLPRDGIAGLQTVALLERVVNGASDIVMASANTIGTVAIDTPADSAMDALEGMFGSPDSQTGWYAGGCDAQQWFKMHWGGFTAIFSDHGGQPARLTGWHVSDLDDLPSWLYFVGGIRPGWDWGDLQAIGGGFESQYFGLWYHEGFGYAFGMFDPHPILGSQPAGNAALASFGVGTGGYAC